MITSEERRAIAARIGEYGWDNGDYATTALLLLAQCLGVDDEDISGRSYGYIARMVADKVCELCEVSDDDAYQHGYDEGFASADDWYADRTEGELLAHGLLRMPKGADGVTVMPGQDVYGGDGGCWRVVGIGGGAYPVIAVPHGARTDEGEYKRLKPSWLRHRRDTPRLLADEIDRWVGSEQDEPLAELRTIARRLRALGGGE